MVSCASGWRIRRAGERRGSCSEASEGIVASSPADFIAQGPPMPPRNANLKDLKALVA